MAVGGGNTVEVRAVGVKEYYMPRSGCKHPLHVLEERYWRFADRDAFSFALVTVEESNDSNWWPQHACSVWDAVSSGKQ